MDENFVREREKAVQAVKECGEEALLGGCLWHAVSLYEGTTFYTSKKLPFTYRIKGRELFCDRKEKSITEATVLRAYKKILEARAAGEPRAEEAQYVRRSLYLGNSEGAGAGRG